MRPAGATLVLAAGSVLAVLIAPWAPGAPGAPGGPSAPGFNPAAVPSANAVRIVRPQPIEILSGVQEIEVEITVPADGAAPPEVEVSVDGTVVARLDHLPYRATFDFGQSLVSRRITARIASGPMTGQSAEIATRALDLRKVDEVARVSLVTLYVSVRTSSGKYVTDLPRESFEVYDEKVRQELVHFGMEKRPLVVAILIDTSFSMGGEPLGAARAAAIRFVKSLSAEDRAMVIAFADAPRVLIEPTTDRERLASVLGKLEAKGGTALYDAIYAASDRLTREEGRKVIVLLSDGRDEAPSGIEPGSLHTFEEALEKALRSEAILYTIGFGKQVEHETDFYGRTPLKEILDRLAEDSGGRFYFSPRPSQLRGVYDLIGEELRNQYALAYSPSRLRADGSWHAIHVELSDPVLKPFTRRGYYAPKG